MESAAINQKAEAVMASLDATQAACYAVVYRTGGTARFAWHRSGPFTREDANQARADLERMGYAALYPQPWAQSVNVGVPETFDGSSSIEAHEALADALRGFVGEVSL